MAAMSLSARQLAEEKYSWEKISRDLGLLIKRNARYNMSANPFFSVIVPSYKRHDMLNALMNSLAKQRYRDFEVVVVDQSDERWNQADFIKGLDFLYIHTDAIGAGKARNAAAFFARGHVLVFTDDDCLPEPDWLYNAKKLFDGSGIMGIEGLIKSDKIDDPAYRPVTNYGFSGIGFMTANLFLKAEVFNRINGFDERFDQAFREDTDLAWRALKYGKIPFAYNVCVFHPPHLRNVKRESLGERNKFFEKDALLLSKHPDKYMELFLKEGHWAKTDGFWENFERGAIKYRVNISKLLKYKKIRQLSITQKINENNKQN